MKTKTKIKPKALYWASFNCFEFRMPGQAVLDCSHGGSCDADVEHWATRINRYEFGEQSAWSPTPEKINAELREHGAWDGSERLDDAVNWQRIVWIAANNIHEGDEPDCSSPVKR